MKRFTPESLFMILVGTLLVSACTLGAVIPSWSIESKMDDELETKGKVTGKICYPSESIPPISVYFQSTLNNRVETLLIEADQDTYSIDLVPGTYVAYSYPVNDYVLGGMYSAMVPCGLTADCIDHSLLPVEVEAGMTTRGIDICDWYAGAGMVPLAPGVQTSTSKENSGESNQGYTAQESGLSAYLELPERLQIGDPINLKFTLTNNSETAYYVLNWYTPLEGFAGRIIRVTCNGQVIPYEGIEASRGAPLPEDYVYLEPGGSTSTIVDPGTVYDFSKAGTYRIAFISPRISHIAYTEDEMAKSVDDLVPVEMPSNTVTLVLDEK
jgi:hypothetical protein